MTALNLIDEHAKMGKISNNLERHGDDDVVTGFTIPIEMRITRGQLQELMGEDFDTCVWTQSPVSGGSSFVGKDWVTRLLPFSLGAETYVDVAAALGLGGRELEFADSKVSHLEMLAFGLGGIVVLKCHLYVRPGIGTENLLLQEYQEHEIAVSMMAGKLRVKADKAQMKLALDEPKAKTERDLAHERGEEVSIITGVVDGTVTHEHPSFNDGRISHPQGLACMVCDGDSPPTHDHPALNIVGCHCGKADDGVATPPDERERAHARERMVARAIEAERAAEVRGDDESDDAQAAA